MANNKLGRPTKERMAMLRGQATALLWYGRIETTYQRAKALQPYVEKILTLAINSYENTVDNTPRLDKDGNPVTQTIKDGTKKLNARRKIMTMVYDVQLQKPSEDAKKDEIEKFKIAQKRINHPLIEKIFDDYAPAYNKRIQDSENQTRGGYTRVIRTGKRNGDNAEMAIIELVINVQK